MKKGQFWALPKDILSIKNLSLEAKVLFGILWTRMNGENLAWPSQKHMAEIMGVGVRSIRRYIKELEKKGLIKVQRIGLRKTNRYLVNNPVDNSFLIGQVGPSREDTVGRSGWATCGPSHSKRTIVREHSNNRGSNLKFSPDDVPAQWPEGYWEARRKLLDKFSMAGPTERTAAQEEAAAEIRPSGKK